VWTALQRRGDDDLCFYTIFTLLGPRHRLAFARDRVRAVDTLGAASAASSAGVAIVLDEDDTSDSDAFEIPESDEESSVGDGLRNTNLAAAKSFAAASVESSEKSGCCEIAV